MTSTPRLTRALLAGAVAVALASAGGCGWFKSKTARSDYTTSTENRPLEVPPDLSLPDTSASTSLPTTNAVGAQQSGAGVTVSGDVAAAYPRVGTALEGIAGVVVNGRAEALGSYEVSYQGQSFLLRLQPAAAGTSRLVALSADGQALSDGPAAALLAALRPRL